MDTRKKTRTVKFEMGYNCRDFWCGKEGCKPGGGGYHGLSGMNIRFTITGTDGVVQFVLGTPFIPTGKSSYRSKGASWMPVDLGYHSRKAMWEGQEPYGPCEHFGGEECYYDGSALNAEDAYKSLVNVGEEDLWRFLEEYYLHVFGEGEYPKAGQYKYPERR